MARYIGAAVAVAIVAAVFNAVDQQPARTRARRPPTRSPPGSRARALMMAIWAALGVALDRGCCGATRLRRARPIDRAAAAAAAFHTIPIHPRAERGGDMSTRKERPCRLTNSARRSRG